MTTPIVIQIKGCQNFVSATLSTRKKLIKKNTAKKVIQIPLARVMEVFASCMGTINKYATIRMTR